MLTEGRLNHIILRAVPQAVDDLGQGEQFSAAASLFAA